MLLGGVVFDDFEVTHNEYLAEEKWGYNTEMNTNECETMTGKNRRQKYKHERMRIGRIDSKEWKAENLDANANVDGRE